MNTKRGDRILSGVLGGLLLAASAFGAASEYKFYKKSEQNPVLKNPHASAAAALTRHAAQEEQRSTLALGMVVFAGAAMTSALFTAKAAKPQPWLPKPN